MAKSICISLGMLLIVLSCSLTTGKNGVDYRILAGTFPEFITAEWNIALSYLNAFGSIWKLEVWTWSGC